MRTASDPYPRLRPHVRALVVLVLLALASFFLPAAAGQAGETAERPVIVGHRGASTVAPENTLAAVDAAHRQGVRWVETDVQRTADGRLVILHDPTLARTTDAERVYPGRSPWKVSDLTLHQIEKLDAGSWFGRRYAGVRVPSLGAYLDRVAHDHLGLLLEIKSPADYPGIEKQVLAELTRQGWLDRHHVRHPLIIQSFDAHSVRTVHALRPDITTGLLGTPRRADLSSYAAYVDQINASYTTIDSSYVAAVHATRGAHGRPLQVFTWTVNDRRTAARATTMGADGLISNAPRKVGDALGAAG